MSSPKDDLTRRVDYLEQYTNTLHIVLDHFVQRIRKVEAATGLDETGISQNLEWRARLEASLINAMLNHNWHWQTSEDPTEVAKGNVAYSQILRLCEMLPIDVQLRCWNLPELDIPKELPLIWSEESPTYNNVSNDIKDQSDKTLAKTLKKILATGSL